MTLVTGDRLVTIHRPPREDPRLGEVLVLDGRSTRFMVEETEPESLAAPIRAVEHVRHAPILDQGSLGSCTGNAGAGALSYDGVWETLSPAMQDELGDATAAEDYAVELYSEATADDPWPGWYDPAKNAVDTGSSGLAVCHVMKRNRLIGAYRWARTIRGLARLLRDGPVMVGAPWKRAFYQPDTHGFIDTAADFGPTEGGHEWVAGYLESVDDNDLGASVVVCDNSWGASWGDAGRFRMRLSTLDRLRAEGCDFKQFVPKVA